MDMGLASSPLRRMIIAASDGHAEGASILAVGNESRGGDLKKRNRAAKLLRQSFSIGANEITRLLQQSASSAVLGSA